MIRYLNVHKSYFFVFFIVLIHFTSLGTGIAHNTSSNIMPGIAIHYDLGLPYIDYNVIYPPGLYAFYYLIGFLKINTAIFYKMIHTTFLIAILLLNNFIFKKTETKFVFFVFATITFISKEVLYFVLPNDLVSSTFISIGIASLIYFKNDHKKLLVSGFFVLLAGLTKDYYLPISLIPIVYLIKNYNLKNLTFLIFGNILAAFVVFSYVIKFGLLNFTIERYYFLIESYIPFLGILSFFLILFLISFLVFKKKIGELLIIFRNIDDVKFISYLICTSFFLQFIAFRIFGVVDLFGHYAIPFVFSFFILISNIFELVIKKEMANIALASLIIWFTFFTFLLSQRVSLYDSYSNKFIPEISIENYKNNPIHVFPDEISKIIDSDSEVDLHIAFGWGGPDFYLEKLIKPYSRLWIMEYKIINNFDSEIIKLKDKLINDPPELIEYCGLSDYCPVDIDFKEFEQKYLPYAEIVTNCYVDLNNNFYLLKDRSCVNNVLNNQN